MSEFISYLSPLESAAWGALIAVFVTVVFDTLGHVHRASASRKQSDAMKAAIEADYAGDRCSRAKSRLRSMAGKPPIDTRSEAEKAAEAELDTYLAGHDDPIVEAKCSVASVADEFHQFNKFDYLKLVHQRRALKDEEENLLFGNMPVGPCLPSVESIRDRGLRK